MSKYFFTFAGGNFMFPVQELLYTVQKLLYTHREHVFPVQKYKIYGREK